MSVGIGPYSLQRSIRMPETGDLITLSLYIYNSWIRPSYIHIHKLRFFAVSFSTQHPPTGY